MWVPALLIISLSPTLATGENFTLEKAIDYAMVHNKELIAAREEIGGAKGKVRATWSNVLPKITAEGGYTYISEVPEINFKGPDYSSMLPPGMPDIPPVEVKNKMGDENNYKAELKLSQLIFASGQAATGIKAMKFAAKATELKVAAKEDDVARQVAISFYTHLLAKELLAARLESLNTSQAHLADVRTKFKNGAASKFELLRSEVEVANLRPEVTKAQNGVKTSLDGLKLLLGYFMDKNPDITGSLELVKEDAIFDSALNTALEERNELAALDAAIDGQKHATWSATAGMLPKVMGFASYVWQKPWYFEEDWTDYYTVGVGISIPLFDGLSALGKRREMAAEKQKSIKQKSALISAIDFTIRKALSDLDESEERVRETGENVGRANQVYQIAEVSYKNGAITNLEVLDAQLALTAAKTNHLKALYDFHLARVELLTAMSRLR